MVKNSAFPYRRGSGSSEKDFFDIPDESVLAVVKRQFRRVRTWATIVLFILLIKWWRREGPPPPPLPHLNYDKIDWSRFAYTQYATSETYLCNSVMVFEALSRLGSRADRVLFYPKEWDLVAENDADRISQLLIMAKEKLNVQVVPVTIEGIQVGSDEDWKLTTPFFDSLEASRASWDTSTAKLFAFGVVQYDRVIHLDSDMTLLQPMDELFFLPPSTVAMPRAYWLLPETHALSSLIAVIEPSYREYTSLKEEIKPAIFGQIEMNLTAKRYDMEVLNTRYGNSATVLPHRQYGLVSGEFRTKNHEFFLGGPHEEWNPDKVLGEAKFVHFSDWPLPKPWVMWPQAQLAELQPACDNNPGTPEESGCRDREVWKELYNDFRRRRKDICKLLSYPAPV
ncbi:Glucose N-acetyltransferase 1 [Penicillium hispanicum]|uniref:Glucose N-acetyltransferase 1 n=1 Tax=Penicillium hispanicum TaxID=1080232 RepID=UPI00254038DB|nr:Glucose N-acetyltransferase 1 [Penicillium hispanicum]KAJ5584766.1 Glucose N-acetyltransferase 1 [Penicillium hispanicum]